MEFKRCMSGQNVLQLTSSGAHCHILGKNHMSMGTSPHGRVSVSDAMDDDKQQLPEMLFA